MILRHAAIAVWTCGALHLVACSNQESTADTSDSATLGSDTGAAPGETDTTADVYAGLFLEFEPTRTASDGSPPLPVRVPLVGAESDVTLPSTVLFEGSWTTDIVQPLLRALAPASRTTPARGGLTFLDATSGATFAATFDDAGAFSLALPAGRWTVGFTADDAGAAPGSWAIAVGSDAQAASRNAPATASYDQALGTGAPLYGDILRAGTQGTGVSGIVYAVSADGTARTAAQRIGRAGNFELRVQPGTWDLVVDPDDAFDPTRQYRVTLDAVGAKTTLSIPPTKVQPFRVAYTLDGAAIAGATVRVRALSLTGVESGSYETEGLTDGKGAFVTDLPLGRYAVELVASVGAPHSAWWTTVDVEPAVDLGIIDVAPIRTSDLRIVDESGHPVVGAQVRVEEGGSGYRTWAAVTAVDGRAVATGSAARSDLVIVPPGDRPDLAQRRLRVEGGALPPSVTLDPGTRVSGTLRDALGAPAAYAAVRVVDAAGRSYALGLTDPDGRFFLRFVPPAADATVAEDPATLDTATAVPIDTGGPGLTR